MEVIEKEKVVKYNAYRTFDGKEFENKSEAYHHEALLNGTRKECLYCYSKGYIVIDYSDHVGALTRRCEKCNGRGYLELRWV